MLVFENGDLGDHTLGEWTVSKGSTCVAGGQKTRKCKVCSYTEYEDTDIDSDAHEWEEDYTTDKEPTCTAAGSESIHCSLCDARKDIKEISPKGHDWSEWKTLVEPTITSEVKKTDPVTFAASRRRKHFLSSAVRRNGNTMRISTGTLMTMAI